MMEGKVSCAVLRELKGPKRVSAANVSSHISLQNSLDLALYYRRAISCLLREITGEMKYRPYSPATVWACWDLHREQASEVEVQDLVHRS
jgi:hypothetical protein